MRRSPPLDRLMTALAALALSSPVAASPVDDPPEIVINEVDSDQAGIDRHDFVELFAASGRIDLSGLILVLYNGANEGDRAYDAIDLYGQSSDSGGMFVIGAPDVDDVDLVAFGTNGLENGTDAVALWFAPDVAAADFLGTSPGDPPPESRLVDALVYGDSRDAGLVAALMPGESIVDENRHGSKDEHAMQRVPDGGAPLRTTSFQVAAPTPGRSNGTPRPSAIHDIQGAAHVSPLVGRFVTDVEGIVTSVRGGAFTLQHVPGTEDDDPDTSEGIVVFAPGTDSPDIGDRVVVAGRVEEHLPGGVTANLSTTQIVATAPWRRLAADQPLPEPVTIGAAGRRPPDRHIDRAPRDDQEDAFDPRRDGLDFFESLESMRVRVDEALAIGPTSKWGEIPVVADAGRHASSLSERGVLALVDGDEQPERLFVDDSHEQTPQVVVGDRFDGPVTGVVDYGFGHFRIQITEGLRGVSAGLEPSAPVPVVGESLVVATYNVENLSVATGAERIVALGRQVVEVLGAPDLLALQEIQDDSGPTDDGVVTSAATRQALVDAIEAAGGPSYRSVDVAPADGRDGGQPGGNIRVAYLYRTDRGLRLVERGNPTARATTVVEDAGDGRPQLRLSPGRVDPEHRAWADSRKPLAAEFTWHGRALFVVNAHLRSKGADTPAFGSYQPPRRESEPQRIQQARIIRNFVARILAIDPDAAIVVLGDLNDREGSPPLETLQEDGELVALIDSIPPAERYTSIYQGAGQVLDHILVSPSLVSPVPPELTLFHLNSEFSERASDHDPARAVIPALGGAGDGLGR